MQRIVDSVVRGKPDQHWVLSQQYPNKSNLSFAGFLDLISGFKSTLRSAGVGPKSPLILISENRSVVLALDLATQLLNGSCIILAPTMEAREILTVIGEHSPALVLYSQPFIADILEGSGVASLPLDRVNEAKGKVAAGRQGAPEIISYTSGSTGRLKGIRHHHDVFLKQIQMLSQLYHFRPGKKALSVLPLNYLYERLFQYAYLYGGVSVEYASPQVSPWNAILNASFDYCATVPMILEKLKEALESDGAALARLKDQPKVFFCSGAMLSAKVLDFYAKHGIQVYEHYGSSETLIIAINGPGQHRPGTAGKLIEPEKVHLTPAGRIVFDTPLVGFTRPALDKKYQARKRYYTGDLGELSDDGFLRIIGRTGSLVKTRQGVFINLHHLEEQVQQKVGLSIACIFYYRHRLRIVAICPQGKKGDEQVASDVMKVLHAVAGLPAIEGIKIDTALCAGDQSCYTSSGKLRRNAVHKWYFPE